MKEEYPGVDGYAVDTIEEAVKDADIVSVSTSSPTGDPELYPYIVESWIKPGAIIETTAALRFDDDFIINRARTVTDNIKLYEAWEEEYAPKAYNTVPIPAVHVEDLIAEGKMFLRSICVKKKISLRVESNYAILSMDFYICI